MEGELTLIQREGAISKKLFERLPARSGQIGYTQPAKEWIRGKSPIPHGTWLLWLNSKDPGKFEKKGIGEFFPISSTVNNPRLISQAEKQRWDIGLHPENIFRGSAGCVVLVWDTPARHQKVKELFNFLRSLVKTTPYLKITVL